MNTSNMEAAHALKNNMGNFLQQYVFPQLEELLEEHNQTGRVAHIDSLNLHITTPRYDNLETIGKEIISQFSENLSKMLDFKGEEGISDTAFRGVEIVSREKSRQEIFLFFLENGFLPWFGNENDIAELTQPDVWKNCLEDKGFITQLLTLLKRRKNAVDRFVLQFESQMIFSFLLKSNAGIRKSEDEILTLLQIFPQKSVRLFLRVLLLILTGTDSDSLISTTRKLGDSLQNEIQNFDKKKIVKLENAIRIFFQKSSLFSKETTKEVAPIILAAFKNLKAFSTDLNEKKNADLSELVSKTENEPEPFFEKQDGEITVQNAGLVSIHPFLKWFFTALGFLDEKGQIIKSVRQVAVQTLHFLATGNEEFFEGSLVFEKFLCGVPLKMPVEKESLLSEKIKAESQQLLTEVIRQWPALKSTSPDGLRQMFFQRNGKLVQKDSGFKLIVERKAQDVLLDKLNWNISLVKVPWRKELLFVEW